MLVEPVLTIEAVQAIFASFSTDIAFRVGSINNNMNQGTGEISTSLSDPRECFQETAKDPESATGGN